MTKRPKLAFVDRLGRNFQSVCMPVPVVDPIFHGNELSSLRRNRPGFSTRMPTSLLSSERVECLEHDTWKTQIEFEDATTVFPDAAGSRVRKESSELSYSPSRSIMTIDRPSKQLVPFKTAGKSLVVVCRRR